MMRRMLKHSYEILDTTMHPLIHMMIAMMAQCSSIAM
jgi:hypothetical protein